MFKWIQIGFLLFPSLVIAHSGGTNSSGCHNDRKGGTGYHCHDKTPVFKPQQPIKKEPLKITRPAHQYAKPQQTKTVLRGKIKEQKSFYSADKLALKCIHTGAISYSANLVSSATGFNIQGLEATSQCEEFSSKYSDITNILTVFRVDTGEGSYRASLELNNNSLSLFHLHKEGKKLDEIPYNRSEWGTYWGDQDGDCQDTRNEVLIAYNENNNGVMCNIFNGLWIDPYTQFEFYEASDLDIDHIVPLAYAHQHGGSSWSPELKNTFYNDVENLLPVSASSNRSKGSKSPSEWMPDNFIYHCQYVDTFLYIVDKYHLDISTTERSNINKQCVH